MVETNSRGPPPIKPSPRTTDDELVEAVKKRDNKAVARLVSEDPSLITTSQGTGGLSPIEVACETGCLPILKTLVEKCKSLATLPVNAMLICAAKNGSLDVMRWLASLERTSTASSLLVKTLVNVPDKTGVRPIQAVFQGKVESRLEMVQLLVDKAGAMVDVWDKNGTTPLHLACCTATDRDLELVKFLLMRGSRADAQTFCARTLIEGGSTPLHALCRRPRTLQVAKLLVSMGGANVALQDHKGETALHLATERGNGDMVRWLLQKNSTVVNTSNIEQETPLHMACELNDISIFRLLVRYGGDDRVPNRFGETPVERIAKADIKQAFGDKDLTELQSIGTTPCKYSRLEHEATGTILHAACKGNRTETVRFLLETPDVQVDIRHKDCHGRSALFYATDEPTVHSFLRHGACVNERDVYEQTPLHLCCEEGRYDAAKALLESGASIISRDKFGLTPFHLLGVNGYFIMAKLLWSFEGCGGENFLNVPRSDGQTPLHTLCANLCCWDGPCSRRFAGSMIHTRCQRDCHGEEEETIHWTPPFLLKVQHNGRLDMLRWMIKDCGADTTIKDGKGRVPLSLVCRHCRDEVNDVLQDP